MINIFDFKYALTVLLYILTHVCSAQNKAPAERDMAGYLMVYFKDDTHGLYFALSKDGYSFTDINQAKPIIAGDTIAEQKGIRDPYIYRANDGYFYVAMTDLHIFAQKSGYRNTEWEREKKILAGGITKI